MGAGGVGVAPSPVSYEGGANCTTYSRDPKLGSLWSQCSLSSNDQGRTFEADVLPGVFIENTSPPEDSGFSCSWQMKKYPSVDMGGVTYASPCYTPAPNGMKPNQVKPEPDWHLHRGALRGRYLVSLSPSFNSAHINLPPHRERNEQLALPFNSKKCTTRRNVCEAAGASAPYPDTRWRKENVERKETRIRRGGRINLTLRRIV